MRRHHLRIPLILGLFMLLLARRLDAGNIFIERDSVSSSGIQGNGWSGKPSISADGNFVAFESPASSFVPNDLNGNDIFVHNRLNGVTSIVSVSSSGARGNNASTNNNTASGATVSADGRFVTFTSFATNLVNNDTNNNSDVFVRDTLTNHTYIASVDSAGNVQNGFSDSPSISGDGRYVAFISDAPLVPNDPGNYDVFVHDLLTGNTFIASVTSSGDFEMGSADNAVISTNGRYVAFETDAINLLGFDTNNQPIDNNHRTDIYVHDLLTGQTSIASLTNSGVLGDGDSVSPSISADGRYVAFHSFASNMTSDDTNGISGDVFAHDMSTGTTELVSKSSGGEAGNNSSYYPAISGDGRFVGFHSDASNLVANDTNAVPDIFLHDRNTGQTIRLSVSNTGAEANNGSYGYLGLSISGMGERIAFGSAASNLVPNDTNGVEDVFVAQNSFVHIDPPNTAPKRNFYFLVNTIKLTWSPVTWAVNYQIQIADNPNFTPQPVYTTTVTGDVHEIPLPTLLAGTYYWRVQAKNPISGWGAWGTVETFTLG